MVFTVKKSLLFSYKILDKLNNQGFRGETCNSFFGNVFGSEIGQKRTCSWFLNHGPLPRSSNYLIIYREANGIHYINHLTSALGAIKRHSNTRGINQCWIIFFSFKVFLLLDMLHSQSNFTMDMQRISGCSSLLRGNTCYMQYSCMGYQACRYQRQITFT